jgi:hypothetical protein
LDIIRTEYGLVKYRNTYPGGPVAYFADVSQGTYAIKNSIYVVQTLLGDAVAVGSNFICQFVFAMEMPFW